MEKKNTGLIVLVVILSIAVLGLGGFIVYDKVLSKESLSNIDNVNKNENKETNDNIEIIPLSKEYKTRINKNLQDIPNTSMNDLKLYNHSIGENIFDDELEKYHFAYWHIIVNLSKNNSKDNYKSDCGYILDGDTIVETLGCIKLSYIQNVYKDIFNDNFKESILYNDNSIIDKNIIKDGYVNLPMAGGGQNHLIKANSLSYDKSLKEYSLNVDFIDLDIDDIDKLQEISSEDYTEYDESLVKYSAIIKYKEIEGRKVLTSWIYTK